MDKELIKQVVREWSVGKLSSEDAMFCMLILTHIQKPSPEALEWAKKTLNN